MDPHRGSRRRRWLQRLAGLAAMWFAGVAGMGLVTLMLRAAMRAAGLSS
jgi:hypothetical protein